MSDRSSVLDTRGYDTLEVWALLDRSEALSDGLYMSIDLLKRKRYMRFPGPRPSVIIVRLTNISDGIIKLLELDKATGEFKDATHPFIEVT